MTLRLVNDTGQHDGTPTCRSATSCRNPATILMKFAGRSWLPACDECARRICENHPDDTQFAPLGDFVDVFAAAKAAALATPEQVIQLASVQIRGCEVADDKVLRRIWIDQAIYCRLHWCEVQGRLTSASQRVNAIGGLWYPACADCIGKLDPSQVEIAPMSGENTAWELEMADKYAKSKGWSKAPGNVAPGFWVVVGILLAMLIAGIALIGHGNALNQAGSDGAAFVVWGVFFVLPSGVILVVLGLIGLLAAGMKIDKAEKRRAQECRQAAPAQHAAPYSQQGIPAGQLATTAALVGTEVLWHHQIREHQARVRDSALGIAPLNNVHAGMKHATAILQQQSQSGSDGNMT